MLRSKSKVPLIVAASALLLTTGCYTMKYEVHGSAADGALMTAPKGKIVRHFVSQDHAWYVLFGLIPIVRPNIDQMIRKEAGGKNVANITFDQHMDLTDGAISIAGPIAFSSLLSLLGQPNLSLLSLALPHTFTVTVEGDVVE